MNKRCDLKKETIFISIEKKEEVKMKNLRAAAWMIIIAAAFFYEWLQCSSGGGSDSTTARLPAIPER